MSDLHEFIRGSEFFADLDAELVEQIVERLEWVTFDKDEAICREGDEGDRMYVVLDGEVAVLKDMDWGHRELKRIGVGEVLGEMSLISKERRSATVQAVEPTACLQLDQAAFQQLLEQDPRFGQRIAQILTSRISALHKRTSDELVNAHRALTFALADLADSRDPETGAHLSRTRNYCVLLADKLAEIPEFQEQMIAGFSEGIYHASPLHDIGKVSIPDAILLKPGKLTDEEFAIMKTHAAVGGHALQSVLEYSDLEVFHLAQNICTYHHERWNGGGYPEGLEGEAIPLEARIMSMADVYDALLSKRVYKAPLTYEETTAQIEEDSGTFFQPRIVEVMMANIAEFEQIHRHFQEG